MKTSLATTISVVGVLAAGGVAFAVNTSVLDSATMTSDNSPALQAEAVPVAQSNVTGSGSLLTALGDSVASPQATTVDASGSSPSTTVVTPTETSTQSAYNIEGFGVVTLEQRPDSLRIVSIVPQSGVTFTPQQETATRIEVAFKSAVGVSIKFHADIIDSRIVTSVMNEPRLHGAPRRKDDDHDSDEHDDDHDEHESGEHDDD